mmetsp:Transcript_23682/g.38589  ORF Transcript_23682/g.38589 Transcript_23682/m.38589 type:complete len:87 (-) Transcript_23682:217-477(-)
MRIVSSLGSAKSPVSSILPFLAQDFKALISHINVAISMYFRRQAPEKNSSVLRRRLPRHFPRHRLVEDGDLDVGHDEDCCIASMPR